MVKAATCYKPPVLGRNVALAYFVVCLWTRGLAIGVAHPSNEAAEEYHLRNDVTNVQAKTSIVSRRRGTALRSALVQKQRADANESPITVSAPPPPTFGPDKDGNGVVDSPVPSLPRVIFRVVTNTISTVILLAGVGIWFVYIPYLIWMERQLFKQTKVKRKSSFVDFLRYRFNYWVSTRGSVAHVEILMIGCLTEVTVGALFYWAVTGNSPLIGLWLVFVWMSASSVEGHVPAGVKILGALATVGGLLLLALLLGTVTDYLAARVEASKAGRDKVIEGGHTLVIGFSNIIGDLLRELEQGAGCKQTIVLLGNYPKEFMDKSLASQHAEMCSDVRLVVRTGRLDNPEDLYRVCADGAARIVIPPGESLSREEADAQTISILLTLRELEMPSLGHITAQCSVAANMATMGSLHDKVYLLSGERLGRMMTQSSRDHGLCQVFTQLIGFDGDEFYHHSAKEFGVVGRKFKDLAFCFSAGVPLGVHCNGEFMINPSLDYVVKEHDDLILLAEDELACLPFTRCYFDRQTWSPGKTEASFCEENPNDQEKIRVLICNFQREGVSCSILFGLEDMCAPGSVVVLYTTMDEAECKEVVKNAQRGEGHEIKNFTWQVRSTHPSTMTAAYEIEDVLKDGFDHIFALADCAKGDDQVRVDQKTVAMVLQMKQKMKENDHFDPVVEICTDTAKKQLTEIGVDNVVNTNLIMQKALAMVTVNHVSHGVLSDLLSAHGNNFDIQELKSYMAPDETIPEKLSFAEATAYVQRGAQQVLVGWKKGADYILNPKDKVTQMPWEDDDCLLVIKDV